MNRREITRMVIPRNEHPKPQFERDTWRCLNGEWDFEIDNGRSGLERGMECAAYKYAEKITVPFCPESRLSGLEHKDFMYGVWYRREEELSKEEISGKVFLNFGAVDYECFVYVNGIFCGSHKGGYVSFKVDITKAVKEGANLIAVNAIDDTRDPMIPSGKQSDRFGSYRCLYTRTTGIWQTVWLEFTPESYIESVKFDTSVEDETVTVEAKVVTGNDVKMPFKVNITYDGAYVGGFTADAATGIIRRTVKLSEKHLWEVGKGGIYDVELKLIGESHEDVVKSYFGLRSIRLSRKGFYINEKPVFQRLILDQGFYPDGIYTAPTDEALAHDIDMCMDMGFNGARLHEKIFEERFLYHADRKGYLVWGEYPNWGLDHTDPMAIYSILPEWLEEIKRDYNHPSIIGWCPFNETWDKHNQRQYDDLIRDIYLVTKAADPYRPCIDTSGNFHTITDIFDVHDYLQDPETMKAHYDTVLETGKLYNRFDVDGPTVRHGDNSGRQDHKGEPVMLTEFGGIKWTADMASENCDTVSWGYGKNVESHEELMARFKGLVDALLDNPFMLGFCYTQLTDVEQEQNGLYTYRREPKFDAAWVKSVVGRKAACEE